MPVARRSSSVIGLRSMEALVEVRRRVPRRRRHPGRRADRAADRRTRWCGAPRRCSREALRTWASTSRADARTSTTTEPDVSTRASRQRPTPEGRSTSTRTRRWTPRSSVSRLRPAGVDLGFAFGAAASHCVSLGMQDEYTQHAVAAEVAEAGMRGRDVAADEPLPAGPCTSRRDAPRPHRDPAAARCRRHRRRGRRTTCKTRSTRWAGPIPLETAALL